MRLPESYMTLKLFNSDITPYGLEYITPKKTTLSNFVFKKMCEIVNNRISDISFGGPAATTMIDGNNYDGNLIVVYMDDAIIRDMLPTFSKNVAGKICCNLKDNDDYNIYIVNSLFLKNINDSVVRVFNNTTKGISDIDFSANIISYNSEFSITSIPENEIEKDLLYDLIEAYDKAGYKINKDKLYSQFIQNYLLQHLFPEDNK